MKVKTIKLICGGVFKRFADSIEDEVVKKLVEQNTIITGGAIASMLLGEEPNDFDMYFRNFETAAAVAKYYVAQFLKNPPTKFKDSQDKVKIWVIANSGDADFNPRVKINIKSAGIAGATGTNEYQYFEQLAPREAQDTTAEYVEKVAEVLGQQKQEDEKEGAKKYRPIFLSQNAITLSHKVQLVIRFFGEPEEIHKNYDFDHCKSWWQSWDHSIHTPASALEALLTKELRYSGSLYPICSMIRARKFIQRGWSITAGQLLKMAFQISNLDLTNYEVLEEQLTGVDHAYFMQLVSALKEHNPQAVDTTYLMNVIDKLF